MEKIVSFDKQGRIYIPEDVRKSLQFKTLVLRTLGRKIVIEPIEDDPIEALAKLGKNRLKGKSIKKLRSEAKREWEEHAFKKIRR